MTEMARRITIQPIWRRSRRALAVAAVAVAMIGGAGRVEAQQATPQAAPPAPVVEKPKGDAEIAVVLGDGKKFTDCTVYARHRTLQVTPDDPKGLAQGLPAEERIAITADAHVGSGAAAVRYVGTAEATIDAGALTKVKVTLKPVKDMDLYCRECHPTKGQRIPRGQIMRDVHVSGKVLEGRYLDQVKAHNAKVEQLRKEGKPAGEPVVLEERVVKVNGKDVKKLFYTCESCHTLHAETAFRKYARAEYLQKSDLCVSCHY
jgi:hypothetical protein